MKSYPSPTDLETVLEDNDCLLDVALLPIRTAQRKVGGGHGKRSIDGLSECYGLFGVFESFGKSSERREAHGKDCSTMGSGYSVPSSDTLVQVFTHELGDIPFKQRNRSVVVAVDMESLAQSESRLSQDPDIPRTLGEVHGTLP